LVVVHKTNKDVIVENFRRQGFRDIAVGDDYNDQTIAVTHFGNLIEMNHWRDFNQVWIVATNILPMELYATYQHFFSQIESASSYTKRTLVFQS